MIMTIKSWRHIKTNKICYMVQVTTVDLFNTKNVEYVIYRDANGKSGTVTLAKWNKYMVAVTEPETDQQLRDRLHSEVMSWPEWKRNITIGSNYER